MRLLVFHLSTYSRSRPAHITFVCSSCCFATLCVQCCSSAPCCCLYVCALTALARVVCLLLCVLAWMVYRRCTGCFLCVLLRCLCCALQHRSPTCCIVLVAILIGIRTSFPKTPKFVWGNDCLRAEEAEGVYVHGGRARILLCNVKRVNCNNEHKTYTGGQEVPQSSHMVHPSMQPEGPAPHTQSPDDHANRYAFTNSLHLSSRCLAGDGVVAGCVSNGPVRTPASSSSSLHSVRALGPWCCS